MRVVWCCALVALASQVLGANFVVAPSDAPDYAKARANVICNGQNDTEVLAASWKIGPLVQTEYDDNAYTMAYSAMSVEWLAGNYYLESTLFLAQSVDSVLFAEGAIFHYGPTTGDAIVITGSLRNRYNLGTIWTSSSGCALGMKDRPYSNPFMPNLMSIIRFQGLQQTPPNGNNGIGFCAEKHFCTNKVEGTDVRGFNMGIYVNDTGEGKVDTNWWWLSYVRGNHEQIVVEGAGVDSQHWFVNVDATLPDGVAIRTAASLERWMIIMGTASRDAATRSIILDPGAQYNWIEVEPPLWTVDGYENNSGYPNNVIVQLPQTLPLKSQRSHPNSTRVGEGDASHLVLDFAVFDDGPGPAAGARLSEDEAVQTLATAKRLLSDGLISEAQYNEKAADVLSRI